MKFRGALLATAISILPLAVANAQAIDGLYVGAGLGLNYLQRESFQGSTPGSATGTLRSGLGPAVVLSLGWGFGNGLRAEVEGNYRENGSFHKASADRPRPAGPSKRPA
jgi:hypothetical protein